MTAAGAAYPVRLAIDYQELHDRVTTAFRIILAIPILVVSGALTSSATGILFVPVLLMLLFRRKYPRWWFDWNLMVSRFSTRIGAYALLLSDQYPSTDEEQSVHLDIDYPDAGRDLNRWLPLVKWLLAIPHFVVLIFLWIAAIVVVIVAWFAILFTGRYPPGMFNFVVGVTRWTLRVEGYALLLVTDRYPPFSLE